MFEFYKIVYHSPYKGISNEYGITLRVAKLLELDQETRLSSQATPIYGLNSFRKPIHVIHT